MNKTYLSRINLIGLSLSLASILIILQMVRIQNSTKHQELSRQADEEYSYAKENYYPERGNIYDRWGRLLAGNEDVYEVGVMLEYVSHPATIAQTLNGVNELNYQDILVAASKKYDPEKSVYAVLTDFLPSGVIDALSQIKQEYETSNPYGAKKNPPFTARACMEFTSKKKLP